MSDLVVANKAFILKILTGILGTAFGYLNKKYNLGVDPLAIAGVTASIIIGVAMHAAAKDHGVTAATAQDAAPAATEVKS